MCGTCKAAEERLQAAERLLQICRAGSAHVADLGAVFRPVPLGPEWRPLLKRLDRKDN